MGLRIVRRTETISYVIHPRGLNILDTLREVFSRLGGALLTLNLATCEFGKAVVTYLGKQVGQGQVWPLSARIQAILDFPVLGTCGYYRGFCKNFASVVVPSLVC